MRKKTSKENNVIDIKEGKRNIKKKKRTPKIVFAVCVIVFAVTLFLFRDRIEIIKWLNTVDTFFGKGISAQNIELSYDGSASNPADWYDGFIAILTNRDVTMYNSSAKAEFKHDVNLNNPVLKCYDKYTLIYDCGGSELYVTNSYKEVFNKQFDGSIINARFTKDGHLVVITKMKNYRAVVTVYSSSFKEVYKVYSASEYVMDADVSNDGKQLAVAVYDGGFGEILSAVNIYNMNSEKVKSRIEGVEGLILSVDMKAGGRTHILTQNGYYVSKDGKQAEEVLSVGSNYLEYYDITKDDNSVIILDGKLVGKSCQIHMFNAYGVETGNVTVEGNLQCYDKTDDFVFAVDDAGLKVYNYDGELTDEMEVSASTEKILASDDGKLVVFETGNVYIIN